MKRLRLEVHFDEGGLRCREGDAAIYVPFDDLTDASLEDDWLGRGSVLVLARGDAEPVRVALQNVTPLEVQRVVLGEIAARASRRPFPPELTRAGRSLRDWLGAVAAGASAGGYRDGNLPRTELAAILVDPHAAIEARAAAAHGLLANDDDEALVATTRAFLEHAMPPLVLAGARMAPGGAALVDDDLVAEILPYLERSDRALTTTPGGEEKVAAALARAKEAIASEPPEAAAERPNGRHRALRGNGADAGRWVGRTWAL